MTGPGKPIFVTCVDEDEEEYGCEYCRNDMPLKDNGHCPRCDAWYPDDGEEE